MSTKKYKDLISEENTTTSANVIHGNFKPAGKFAGKQCFYCSDDIFSKVYNGKKKHVNWKHHLGDSPETAELAKVVKDSKIKTFLLKNSKNGTMMNVRA